MLQTLKVGSICRLLKESNQGRGSLANLLALASRVCVYVYIIHSFDYRILSGTMISRYEKFHFRSFLLYFNGGCINFYIFIFMYLWKIHVGDITRTCVNVYVYVYEEIIRYIASLLAIPYSISSGFR